MTSKASIREGNNLHEKVRSHTKVLPLNSIKFNQFVERSMSYIYEKGKVKNNLGVK